MPVLDTPLNSVVKNSDLRERRHRHQVSKGSYTWIMVAVLAVALGILLVGGVNQEQSITTVSIHAEDKSASRPAHALAADTSRQTTPAKKKTDIPLINNLVDLIIKEQFAQETTIGAFITLWQQIDDNNRAILNSSPWFLQFVFSVQKKARHYLQSPESYNTDFTIKQNRMLKLAVVLDVMDQQGNQSSAETYQTKQNLLVESLTSDIATIEVETKKHVSSGESMAAFNEILQKRYGKKH